jgi:hypothetical protein
VTLSYLDLLFLGLALIFKVMNEIKKIDLKIELDKIDQECIEFATDKYYNSRLKLLIGMWGKGELIDVFFRGVKNTNYNQIEKETGRRRANLKQWHEIYKKYP